VLWIDGNNVRGIGKFEWNAVELQNRVVRFCHKHKIANVVLVWDHGSYKFASSTRYSFDDFGLENPGKVALTQTKGNDTMFHVNLVILFSGIRQRADDVIVKESNHLVTSFQHESVSNSKIDWASLAFVTNDRDLNFKLRRQATPNPTSIRLSRRKRMHDNGINPTSLQANESNRKDAASPLFLDSSGFLDMLYELPGEYDMELKNIDTEASESIEKMKASIRQCSRSQRRSYNSRREKTWERCIQAETLRRFLDTSLHVEDEPLSEVESTSNSEDENSVFVANYLLELRDARGYSISVQNKSNCDIIGNSDDHEDNFLPFLGPARLDRHQRRLLGRFNALLKNGEVNTSHCTMSGTGKHIES
jgi:hypothetical protein